MFEGNLSQTFVILITLIIKSFSGLKAIALDFVSPVINYVWI